MYISSKLHQNLFFFFGLKMMIILITICLIRWLQEFFCSSQGWSTNRWHNVASIPSKSSLFKLDSFWGWSREAQAIFREWKAEGSDWSNWSIWFWGRNWSFSVLRNRTGQRKSCHISLPFTTSSFIWKQGQSQHLTKWPQLKIYYDAVLLNYCTILVVPSD